MTNIKVTISRLKSISKTKDQKGYVLLMEDPNTFEMLVGYWPYPFPPDVDEGEMYRVCMGADGEENHRTRIKSLTPIAE